MLGRDLEHCGSPTGCNRIRPLQRFHILIQLSNRTIGPTYSLDITYNQVQTKRTLHDTK